MGVKKHFFFKSRIRDTRNLSMCADSNNNTMKSPLSDIFVGPHFGTFQHLLPLFGTFFRCCIFCHLKKKKKIPCNMSQPQPQPHTFPSNSQTICSRLVSCPKISKNIWTSLKRISLKKL